MPLFHIGGSGWALIGFYRGVDTVLMRDPDPAAILRLIPEYRITKAFMVPALLLFIVAKSAVPRPPIFRRSS